MPLRHEPASNPLSADRPDYLRPTDICYYPVGRRATMTLGHKQTPLASGPNTVEIRAPETGIPRTPLITRHGAKSRDLEHSISTGPLDNAP